MEGTSVKKERTIELELLVDILVLLRLVHRHVDRHDVLKLMEMSFDRNLFYSIERMGSRRLVGIKY